MSFKRLIEKLPPGPDIDILLMGKSGHGKSSTGNSILGRKLFKAMGGDRSITDVYEVGFTKMDGRVIKVVDIPGLCDTQLESDEAKEDLVRKAISGSLRQFPRGLSALVLVLSYTSKFTKEEREAIQTLREMLGDDVLNMHTVCVFTHGKNFETEYGEEEDFVKWCKERKSAMKNLLQEIKFRCVLFENLVKDPIAKKSQLCKLVSKIDDLTAVAGRYTFDKFSKVEEMTLKLDKYKRENGMIKDSLDKIRDSPPEEQREELKKLKERIESLQQELTEHVGKDFDGVKDSLKTVVENIALFEDMIEKENKLKLEKEKMKAEITRRVQVQREAFENMMSDLLLYVDKTEVSLDEEMQKTDLSKRIDAMVKDAGIKMTAFCYTD